MKQSAFIFDDVRVTPQRQIGMHSHPQYELSHVLCGAGTRTIGDLTEPFVKGEIILIPPGIQHVWHFDPAVTDAEGNISNISVFFDPTLLTAMMDIFPEIAQALDRLATLSHAVAYRGERYPVIRQLLMQMRGMTPQNRLPLMVELLVAISDFTGSVFSGQGSMPTRTEKRLEKVRVYCACNYAGEITLDEISRHVGMNKSAFCTFMRNNTGMTFSEYLNGMRLDRAADRLLHTDAGIAEIAIGCGFRNVTYFNRLFRKKYNCSPKGFRRAVSL